MNKSTLYSIFIKVTILENLICLMIFIPISREVWFKHTNLNLKWNWYKHTTNRVCTCLVCFWWTRLNEHNVYNNINWYSSYHYQMPLNVTAQTTARRPTTKPRFHQMQFPTLPWQPSQKRSLWMKRVLTNQMRARVVIVRIWIIRCSSCIMIWLIYR